MTILEDDDAELIVNAVDKLSSAIRSISHGGNDAPAGLEGLTVALVGGSPLERPSIGACLGELAAAVDRTAAAFESIAASLERLTLPLVKS